jgi:quinoprotein glucose dehydrogenase
MPRMPTANPVFCRAVRRSATLAVTGLLAATAGWCVIDLAPFGPPAARAAAADGDAPPAKATGTIGAAASPTAGEDDSLPAPSGKPAHYVAPASDEAAEAMRSFKLPAGWKVDLFAAEPRVANPVCLSLDDLGRVYVVETFRRRNAVLDIRKLPTWLDEDLACRTVADRIAMVKRHLPSDWHRLEGTTDRVRRIEDSDGDGRADKDTVFADKFDKLEDGTAAGVLSWGDSVYFTDIPNLWKLKDTTGAGVADQRESLHYGFGVRYAYSGHDFHGLRMGPDGRLYFSIADRGLHVEDKAGRIIVDNPDSGAVLRCEPDGSHLELVHTGLRNPQELAFDEFGNLFTGDNNSDGGDPTRWVYVVEGGDSGWHVGWQWNTNPVSRGAWIGEELCQVEPKVPAYYRLPPIATPKIAGPAGLTYAPGTGLPPEWAGRFFLVDFRGGAAGGSGVYALKNKPKGASFELDELKDLVTNTLPTDVEFGPDGRMYFTDWVTGWEPHGKGRVYALTPPGGGTADPAVAEVKKLLAEGFGKRPDAELAKLLAHADQRVRQRAQFALSARGNAVVPLLQSIAKSSDVPLARVHAVWGLGQIARRASHGMQKAPDTMAANHLTELCTHSDPEVRAQVAKVLGDARTIIYAEAHPQTSAALLAGMLGDKSPRVRYFAAASLGKLDNSFLPLAESIKEADIGAKVLALLRKNNDADAYLRHAGVMALVGLAASDPAVLEKAAADDSAAVRMAALLAYRKQASPQVARFLDDADPNLVLEAARAVNDLTITAGGAMDRLAEVATRPGMTEPVLYRALNANYRIGTPTGPRTDGAVQAGSGRKPVIDGAKDLATFAARSDVPPTTRIEALRMLGLWARPSGRDRVTGLWRPVPERPADPAKAALAGVLDKLLADAPDAVRLAALNAGTALGVTTTPLVDLATNAKNPPGLRAAAVAAMAEQNDPKLPEAVKVAMASADPAFKLAGVRALPATPGGMKALADALATGTPREQQAAVQTAAALMAGKDKTLVKDGESLLQTAMGRLEKQSLPVEAQLDLLDAAATKKTGKLADRRKAYEAARAKAAETDPLAAHRETLAGGDAERGAYVFRERADVSCLRCHAVKGVGGNAGPDLSGVVTRNGGPAGSPAAAAAGSGPATGASLAAGREYILESILYPSKKVAAGWETVALYTADGDVVSGVLKAEDDQTVSLEVPNQGQVKVEKAKVRKRQGGLSAMPDDISKTLSKQDLRDLVEFLAGQ